MELIITIIIAVIIKLIKENPEKVKSLKKNNIWHQRIQHRQQSFDDMNMSKMTEWQVKARENIARAAAHAKKMGKEIKQEAFETMYGTTKSSNSQATYEMPKRVTRNMPVQERLNQSVILSSQAREKELSASQQIQKRQMENKNRSILQRAKENVAEEAVDETLHSMQKERRHLENVSLAVHNHSEDFVSSDILETISDLMTKGYEGNLCFERDFLGEGMDMISHFQPPTEIPSYSISEMEF